MNMNRDEYEMQLYGLTQNLVVSSVKETFNETLCVVLDSLSRKLVTKYSHEVIGDFKTALINAYNNSIEKHNADLERIVAECFSIDPTILLPEDEIQKDNRDGSYEANLDRQYDIAKRQLIALTVLEEKLKLLVEKISGDGGIVDELLALKDLMVHRDNDCSDLVGTLDHAGLVTLLVSKLSLSELEKNEH